MQNDKNSLTLYILNDPGLTADIAMIRVVLRHADGSLGLDRRGAEGVLAALVDDAVVIERANHPRFHSLTRDRVSLAALHVSFHHGVTCSAPGPELLFELDQVKAQHLIQNKNVILARNGRPIEPLPSTRFDDWILEQNVIRDEVSQWLVANCSRTIDWRFSDWGFHGCILGRSPATLIASMESLAEGLGIPVCIVQREHEMPCW